MTRLTASRLDVPAVITTARLRLVESDPAWAPQFAAAMAASSDSLRFTPGWREAAQPSVAAASLQTSLDRAADDVVRHAFVGDTYVARIDLHSWDDEVPKCELGYVANAAILGHGLVTEACQTMIDIAWSMGVVRVQAVCDSRNERAIRMAERLGMRREGVLRHNDRDEAGSLVDEVILAITRG